MSDFEPPVDAESPAPDTAAEDEARRLHHLASADPEIDGPMTGAEHEAKYGIDRSEGVIETAVSPAPLENTAAPRASDS